jgi:hypothetical protein
MDAHGKLIMECLLETKAATILEFIQGLHGTLSLTFEEGTSAAWLHDLLKPHVSRLVVCDPRKNALLKDGNKSDRVEQGLSEQRVREFVKVRNKNARPCSGILNRATLGVQEKGLQVVVKGVQSLNRHRWNYACLTAQRHLGR